MKTTDSVMREKLYIELVGAVARGWTTKENEKKVMDTELAKAITEQVYDLYSHSLAEARREWVEEMRGLKKPDNDCRHSPEDSCDSNCTYQNEHKIYNQAIDDVVDLLTGDNPEEAKV